MACLLTIGRGRPCYDSMAGLKAVYFADYNTLGTVSYSIAPDTDEIKTLGGAPEFFKFDLKGSANTYTETITKGIDAGTSFYAQSLAITLPKLTKEMHSELKLMVYNSPHVIIEDFNGNFFLMGLTSGADVISGTIVTGGARGDLSGYTLTMTADEALAANFIFDAGTSTVITDTTATIGTQMSP